MPVRLHPAIAEHRLQFHLIHEPDESPIGYQKICKLEDKPVPDEEIVKAFEIRKGEYVHLSDEDFEAARSAGGRSMEITDFVPYAEIDPISSPGPTTSARGRAASMSTRSSPERWRIRSWPRSSSSCCATASISGRFAWRTG
jgi:hypothetical protein